LYGTIASKISGNSTNSHIPQLAQSNYSNLNAYYPQTGAQHQFPSYSYPNPLSYQASGISYPLIVSDANLASMYTTSTNSNYIHQNLHQTGNTNLSKSSVLLTSTTNFTKESLVSKSQFKIELKQKKCIFISYFSRNFNTSNNNLIIFEHLVN